MNTLLAARKKLCLVESARSSQRERIRLRSLPTHAPHAAFRIRKQATELAVQGGDRQINFKLRLSYTRSASKVFQKRAGLASCRYGTFLDLFQSGLPLPRQRPVKIFAESLSQMRPHLVP